MLQTRLMALLILLVGLGLGWFALERGENARFPLRLGLDLAGGTHLLYEADTSEVVGGDIEEAMSSLRDVVERRANLFGVAEPLVQTERSSALAGGAQEYRLVVELPGVENLSEAVAAMGATPSLEFKLIKENAGATVDENGVLNVDAFTETGLTGRYVAQARLQFGTGNDGNLAGEPLVLLQFNSEGSDLFEKITSEHVGDQLAIFLDGVLIQAPVIRETISGGSAVISGGFTPEHAKALVRDLNFGALPLPISLVSAQSVGPTLGAEALAAGLTAGFWGLIAVAVFLVLWYRLPGVVSVLALGMYLAIMVSLFKLVPVVLTAAGIAAFILSIGLAVDANILIFERMKEEFAAGKHGKEAIREGFSRAWLSIRDANMTSIIAAVILFWFGTSLIKGFALVFGLGVLVSMLSAITISRTFLLALPLSTERGIGRFLMKSGLSL